MSWWMGRLVRRYRLGGNPLRRRSDRIETAVLIGALVVGLVGIPIGVQANEVAYQAGARAAAERAASVVQTHAVLLADAPAAQPVRVPVSTVNARAEWHAPDGSTRTGDVSVAPGTRAGTDIPVWTDQRGSLVRAPLNPTQLSSRAVAVAVGLGLGWFLVMLLVFAAVRWVLDRKRMAEWEADWERAERNWRRPAR